MDIWIYVTNSLCSTHETTTTLLINYTPIKFLKKWMQFSFLSGKIMKDCDMDVKDYWVSFQRNSEHQWADFERFSNSREFCGFHCLRAISQLHELWETKGNAIILVHRDASEVCLMEGHWFPSSGRNDFKHYILLPGRFLTQFCINLQIHVSIPNCLYQGLANFSWEGPNNKCFRLYGSSVLFYNHPAMLL